MPLRLRFYRLKGFPLSVTSHLGAVSAEGPVLFIFSRASSPSEHSRWINLTENNGTPWFPRLRIFVTLHTIMSVRWSSCTRLNTTILLILWLEVIESLWSVWYSKRDSFEIHYYPDRTLASKLGKVVGQLSRTRQIDFKVSESWSFSIHTSSRDKIRTRFHFDLPLHCLLSVNAWPGCHELQKSIWPEI